MTYTTEQEQLDAFYASLIVDLTPLADSTDTEAYVTELYDLVLGRAPDAQGLVNISAAVDAGTFDVNEFIATALTADLTDSAFDYLSDAERAAAVTSQTNLVAEQNTYNTSNPVVIPDPVEEPGDTIWLTSGTDRDGDFNGTADADQFNAYIQQNPFAGGVSNSLSSADVLDGGAGTDTLYAEIVPEFFGTAGYNTIDVQPRTSNIENVTFEARDGVGYYGGAVTVDAKYMTDIDSIGSKFSDGDLVIENLTTLESNGNARNTSDITITMDHTDNFNSDQDASDLTVYFDEDYLITNSTTAGATLTINMINTLNNKLEDPAKSLIEGFDTVTFSVGETEITVDVTGAELSEVKGLIEDALTAAGITTVNVTTYEEPAFFATNIYYEDTGTTYVAGTQAGPDYTAFILTNSGPETLSEGGFTLADGSTDGSLAYSQDDRAPETSDNPLSVNVDLHKVGREGEGGNLIIGGKELDSDSGAEDQGNGIPVFNIDVLGDASKPSNLGVITSTNDALRVVNIATHADYVGGETFASLTVRGEGTQSSHNTTTSGTNPFGGTLDTLNANSFLGDLDIGQDTAALNIDTFTATGGGDVTLVEDIDVQGNFSVSTGSGVDVITVDLDGSAVDTVGTGLTINTAGGADTVTVTGSGNVSDATTLALDNLHINTGGGADRININAEHIYRVDAGADSDFVVVDANNSTMNGTTGTWTIGDGTDSLGTDWADRVLYEATVTVDFAGFTETIAINTNSSTNFIATQSDINDAIIAAIAANDELKLLLTPTATTGTEQSELLTIVSTVQGVNDLTISVFQPTVIATGPANATQVVVGSSHVSAIEAGLIATTAMNSDYIDASGITGNSGISGVEDVEDAMAAFAGQGNLNETGAAAANDFVLDSDNTTGPSTASDGTNNTTATSNAIIDMGTGAHDLVVLDSDNNSSDTIVFSSVNWGKVSVLNFFNDQLNTVSPAADGTTIIDHTIAYETIGLHEIDFTAWLVDENSDSGSSASAVRTATTDVLSNANAIDLSENEVTIINNFAQDLGDGDTWATMTSTDIDTALTGGVATDDYGTDGAASAIQDATTTVLNTVDPLLGTTIHSILMVENDLNDGEYKVFEVVTSDVNLATEAFAVTELGVIDFGETIDTAAIFA